MTRPIAPDEDHPTNPAGRDEAMADLGPNLTNDGLPSSPCHRPSRRPLTTIDESRRTELLNLVAQGKGIDQALRQMDLSRRAYLNTIRSDTGFRAEVASARRAGGQRLDEFGYRLAFSDVDILMMLWRRRDKADRLNQARADRARERAEDRASDLKWARIQRRLAREERRERLIELEAAAMAPGPGRDLFLHLVELRKRGPGGGRRKDDEPSCLDRLSPEEVAAWHEAAQQIARDLSSQPWSLLP